MNRTKLPSWLIFAVLVPALLSLYSIYRRFQAETLNRAIAFATEYETVENYAAAQGLPIDKAAAELKAQGLNAIVLSEETVTEMIARGRLTISSTYIAGGQDLPSLRFSDPRDLGRVQKGLAIRLQALAGPLTARDDQLPLPPISPILARSVAIGLNPGQAAFAKRNGLIIIARCSNPSGVSAKTVEQTLEWAHDMGATIFLPQGDQVIGRRESIDTTIDTLKRLGMAYATAEFAKIGGDEDVVRTAPDIVVRLHSASAQDLDKLSLPDAVERYAKASRERNMRVLLIRPFSSAAEKPLTAFGEFIRMIRDQVTEAGGALGEPKPFEEPRIPHWFPVLIGLSIVPAGWFVGASFIADRRVRVAGAVLLSVLALASIKPHGAQITAFIASLVFPVAAFLVLDAWRPKNVLVGFFAVSAVSLVGGLCVAGMLNGLPYYVMAEQFLGVKVSIFLPILIVGFLFLERLANTRDVWRSPITWGTAGLGLVIVALLGIMIARTGNDTGVGPSGGETMFRGLLDRFLYVRPRTKEFLIGHPLLVVGIGMLAYLNERRDAFAPSAEATPSDAKPFGASSLPNWTVLVLMVGSMGQTSIVNTLTHLHIPVMLSLARVGLGLVIGSIMGLGLWIVVSRFLPKPDKAY